MEEMGTEGVAAMQAGEAATDAARKRMHGVLVEARRLLAEPGAWIQGRGAQNALGEGTGASDPEACQWCLWGALYRAGRASGMTYPELRLFAEELTPYLGLPGRADGAIATWNDNPGRTQADVLALLDTAIARAAA